jgi:hypothetical protein
MRWSMLKSFSKRSGNKYTIISIIMIILMMYLFKFTMGGTEVNYPQYIYYGDHKYEFNQIVNESSFKFQREYGRSYEGHILLLMRGERDTANPVKVYIFTKWRKYREYELVK